MNKQTKVLSKTIYHLCKVLVLTVDLILIFLMSTAIVSFPNFELTKKYLI